MSSLKYVMLSPQRKSSFIRVLRDADGEPVLDRDGEPEVIKFEHRVIHRLNGDRLAAVLGDIGNALIEVDQQESESESDLQQPGELLEPELLEPELFTEETTEKLKQIGAIEIESENDKPKRTRKK